MIASRASRTDRLVAAWALLRRLEQGLFVILLVALAGALSLAVVPRGLGYGTLVVQGGSMGHSVPTGSLVLARLKDAEDVRVGDVILVKSDASDGPDHPVIHRVVWIEMDGERVLVRTKGDANETPDPNVHILPGRVHTPALTLPYLGYLVAFVVTPLGWALLVALPSTVVCALTVRSIWSDKPGPKERSETEPHGYGPM